MCIVFDSHSLPCLASCLFRKLRASLSRVTVNCEHSRSLFGGFALPHSGIPATPTLDFHPPASVQLQDMPFSLSSPQPDHFVQDPAMLREKAEARRLAFLARKG